jgi:hypothetical protein
MALAAMLALLVSFFVTSITGCPVLDDDDSASDDDDSAVADDDDSAE